VQLQPYLFFEGRCDEAIAFYRGALGADLVLLATPPGFRPLHYQEAVEAGNPSRSST
jgi:PhnB protein